MNKGFIWTIELVLGLIALWGVWSLSPIEENPTSNMPETLCTDLATLYTYGTNVDEIIQLYYSEWPIETSAEKIEDKTNNSVVCHSTRIENGNTHSLFIRIPK